MSSLREMPSSIITLTNADGSTFPAYVAEPVGEVKGAVVVIHEIWGLVEHITAIADRFAAEGYLAIAPDILSEIGIEAHIGLELQQLMFSTDPAVRSAGQPRLRDALAPLKTPEYSAWALASLRRAVDEVASRPVVDGRVAVVGFCFGGSNAFLLASDDARIRAAIPFYGSAPSTSAISAIGCPILAFYGSTDTSLIEALPALTETMAAAGVDFTSHVYEGRGHAFFNDTNSLTYDAVAAADAWERALEFLSRTFR